MTLANALDDTSILALKAASPDAYFTARDHGYTLACDNVLGRCHGSVTLFLEVDHLKNRVLGWIWDVKQEVYLGNQFDVRGPLGAATELARHAIESTLAEELLSGGVARHATAKRERLVVA